MTIEPRLSPDQRRQINHLAPGGVLANDNIVDKAGPADIVVFDVGELADAMIAAIERWFADLQRPDAADRREHVVGNLPLLVTIKEQTLPTATGIQQIFRVTHTSTG